MKQSVKYRWKIDGIWGEWTYSSLTQTSIDRMYISASMRGVEVEVVPV